MSLDENLNDYFWLDSLDYKVNFLGKGLLDITLMMEGSGAYPDGQSKTLVIDLVSGDRLFLPSEFANLGGLLRKIDAKRQTEIAAAKKEAQQEGVGSEHFDSWLKRTKWSASTLEEFSISADGLTFLYDYGFPRVARALEPEGRFSFTWAEIDPYLKSDSKLKRLSRKIGILL